MVQGRSERTMSTLSSDRSEDSYRKKYTMTAPVRLHAAKTNPYRNLIALTMNGVKNARRKFHSQLLAVEIAACFARVRVGNVSPTRIQIPGAQVDA